MCDNMQTKINKNAALVLLSGGQDSTTCLFWAKKHFNTVVALAFDYQQKHKLELECAENICTKNNIEFHVLDLNLLNQLAPNSLTRADIPVDQQATENQPPNSFVDGRNMLFLTFAGIFAKQRNISQIITGVSESDFSGYPDCRDIFIKSLNVTLNLSMDYQFLIHTPLMWLNKKEIWQMAYELDILDLIKNETLTCYNGIKGNGCGNCPSCTLRRKGLEDFEKSHVN
jgi:7-cyano-7-deazaguanine synthase